jgi:TPR repeat protein
MLNKGYVMNKGIKKNHVKSFIIPAVMSSLIVLSATSVEVKANNYNNGLAEYKKGHYTKAFQLIKLSAESGNAKSQYILSTMYRRGLGVEKNDYEGFLWCEKAAEQEVIEAKFQLGLMYLHGEGITDDEDLAVEWLWSASEDGYPQAGEMVQFIFSDAYATDYEEDIGC